MLYESVSPSERMITAQDCEQLIIATNAILSMQYSKMNPYNELVTGSLEAYCLAEPGAQYMVYSPNGGDIKIKKSETK